jgi:hypothetical protein
VARVAHPWHDAAGEFYHDNTSCTAYAGTPLSRRVFGTGGARPCPECAGLNGYDLIPHDPILKDGSHEFDLANILDHVGMTADGRKWRATWMSRCAFLPGVKDAEVLPSAWTVSIGEKEIGMVPRVGSDAPSERVDAAVRQLLHKNGISAGPADAR